MKKGGCFLSLAFIVSVMAFAQTKPKQKFVQQHNNPHFDIGGAPAPFFRDPLYDGAADPTAIWDGKAKEWLVFYTARRAITEADDVTYCYGTAIGIAASSDYGKTWRYKGTAALPQPDTGLNTFWAPEVIHNKTDGLYHMYVTYIKGVYTHWGGEKNTLHFTSKDLKNWNPAKAILLPHCIDASVFRLKDGTWKMWYKNESKKSQTYAAVSKDLENWRVLDSAEVKNRGHEAPVVFYWKNFYWMITDPTYNEYTGLDVFRSNDGTNWTYNNTILHKPGLRPDDIDQGRHADVEIADGKAIIFYFTHPGRVYPKKGPEDSDENRWRYRRSSLQVAELELTEGKIICNRDKYALVHPKKQLGIPQ